MEIELNFHSESRTNVPLSHVKEQVLIMEDRNIPASDVVTRPRTLLPSSNILTDDGVAVTKIGNSLSPFPLVGGRVDIRN